MIFSINTTRDISKCSQISRAVRRVKLRITILKYHSWYLCQISLLILLLPILIITKNIGKEEKKKWQGDLTETIGAYERLGLLEL